MRSEKFFFLHKVSVNIKAKQTNKIIIVAIIIKVVNKIKGKNTQTSNKEENIFQRWPVFTIFYKRSDCICDVLRDLVPFAQFKKCEKHPWRSESCRLSPATLLKVALLHGCFSRFVNCANSTKSRKASHIVEVGSWLLDFRHFYHAHHFEFSWFSKKYDWRQMNRKLIHIQSTNLYRINSVWSTLKLVALDWK